MNAGTDMLLDIRDLVVSYPARYRSGIPLTAVRGVSLGFPEAGIYGLVGESGSGKSTLAHAVAGLVPASGGQILFRGQDLSGVESRGRKVQLVFQDTLGSLSPRRTVLHSLLEPLDHFNIDNPASRVETALETREPVGLEPALQDRYPNELSGGQRQRVALARALVAGPELVIADEPLSSLDVPAQARIIDLILELRDRLGVAFLFVSHDLSTVRRLADTVGVMYAGKLVEEAATGDLFRNPSHPYTRALLAAVPIADPTRPRPAVLGGEPPSPLTPPAGCVFHMRCPERIAVCSVEAPPVTAIGEPGGTIEGNRELKSSGHRVRCHLCNATNS